MYVFSVPSFSDVESFVLSSEASSPAVTSFIPFSSVTFIVRISSFVQVWVLVEYVTSILGVPVGSASPILLTVTVYVYLLPSISSTINLIFLLNSL